jgi:hypothetical protein
MSARKTLLLVEDHGFDVELGGERIQSGATPHTESISP